MLLAKNIRVAPYISLQEEEEEEETETGRIICDPWGPRWVTHTIHNPKYCG